MHRCLLLAVLAFTVFAYPGFWVGRRGCIAPKVGDVIMGSKTTEALSESVKVYRSDDATQAAVTTLESASYTIEVIPAASSIVFVSGPSDVKFDSPQNEECPTASWGSRVEENGKFTIVVSKTDKPLVITVTLGTPKGYSGQTALVSLTIPTGSSSVSEEVATTDGCVDDPTGDVKKAGVSCTMLKGMGCDTDINSMDPSTPKGTFVKMVCPASCDACPKSNASATAPVESATAEQEKPTGKAPEGWFKEYADDAKSEHLSDDMGYKVHYKIDNDEIIFGVEAYTKGYAAFGFAEKSGGSMKGADILFGMYDQDSSSVVIKDAHALGKIVPVADDSQDWTLLGGNWVDGLLYFAAKRKLKTNDIADRDVDTIQIMPVIYAIGDVVDGKWQYHGSNRALYGLDFRPNTVDRLQAIKDDPDVMYYDLSNSNTLNSEVTQYADSYTASKPLDTLPSFLNYRRKCIDEDILLTSAGTSCQDLLTELAPLVAEGEDACDVPIPGLGRSIAENEICRKTCKQCIEEDNVAVTTDNEDPIQIVAFEVIVAPGAKKYLHHFVVYESGEGIPNAGKTIWAWAPGTSHLVLPDECGFSDVKGLHLNTHWDNPDGTGTGFFDTSGVRVYYTKKQRKHDCGVMQLGDGTISLNEEILPAGYSRSSFMCPKEATNLIDQDQPLNVFGSLLHMHRYGKRAWTTVKRGEETFETNRVDFYDDAVQLTVPLNVQIKKGDSLVTSCVFYTAPDGEVKRWGFGSDQEMCIDFVYYWPLKQELSYCGAEKGFVTELHVELKNDEACFAKKEGECSDNKDQDVPLEIDQCAVPRNYVNGVLQSLGQSCKSVKETLGCDFDLQEHENKDVRESAMRRKYMNFKESWTVADECLTTCGICVEECVDDADSHIAEFGTNCPDLAKSMSCSSNVASEPDPAVFLWQLCPKTCNACDGPPETDGCVDDPTGDVKKAGVSCTMLTGMGCDTDLNSMDPTTPKGILIKMLCPASCNACPKSDAPTTDGCVDDPTGDVKKAGASCTMLKGMGCDTDINSMDPTTPKGTFVKMICPASCDACPKSNVPATDGCVDDPTGDVKKAGASCTMLKGMGCDTDINSMDPTTPKGTFVKMICPASCDACPKSNAPATAPVPVPPVSVKPTCRVDHYKIVSARFLKKCADYSKGKVTAQNCVDKEEQKFRFSGKVLAAGKKCVNTAFKLVKCGGDAFTATTVGANLVFKNKKGKCMQVLNDKGAIGVRKCNAKRKDQKFFAQLIL